MSLDVPSWSTTELDLIRVGLGFVVIRAFSRMPSFRPTGTLPNPVGLARLVDLGWLASRSVARYMQYGAYIAALCYAADVLVPVALLYLMTATILELTYQSSHGSVNHARHLLAVVLTAETAAVFVWNAAEQWAWDLGSILGTSQQATATWWAVQAIIAVYFTSGLSKLINTGGRWAGRSNRLLLAAYGRVETDRMTGKNDPVVSDRTQERISWLLDRPSIARYIFAAGLCLELATPIGLSGPTVLTVTGLGLIALHWGNQFLLRIPFTEFQILVFIYLVNAPQFLH
jgi:hypothetical protein